LDEMGLLHLRLIPDIAQQELQHNDPSFSTQHLSNIHDLQQLLIDPVKFYHSTRISITEFIVIHDALKDTIIRNRSVTRVTTYDHTHSHPLLTSAEQLLLWMWYVVGSPTQTLELIFGGLHHTTIFRYVDHLNQCINEMLGHFIEWPDQDTRKSMYGMMSLADEVVAVLDGTHCEIQRPSYGEDDYYSGYKGCHTQNFLVAVNPLGMIIYVDGPYPGRQNDRGVYNQSDLAQHPERYVTPGELILADGGFIGGAPLICPIHIDSINKASSEEVKNDMIEFNEELSSNRVLVEDVFSWLKSRAHVLASKFRRNKESQKAVFFAACCFYNFIRSSRIEYALI